MKVEINKIEDLAKLLTKYGLSEIEVANEAEKIVIKKEIQDRVCLEKHTDDNLHLNLKNSEIENHYLEITQNKKKHDEIVEESVKKVEQSPTMCFSTNEDNYIKAPTAGIFYRQSQPDKPPYVSEGEKVKKGDVICLIEVMKMINEVVAEHDGIVNKFLVDNEQFVEYGQPLALIVEEE